MKFFEYTLSENDILAILDALLQYRLKLYYEEIELKGEGKSTYSVTKRLDKCQNMISYFESRM